MAVAMWTWPSKSGHPANFVETITDPAGTAHTAFGICASIQCEVPKTHRKTGRIVGTEWADGYRPCGRIGSLEEFEFADGDEGAYIPVYWCPEHS